MLTDLLIQVGRDRDRDAFAGLFTHFAPRLKSYLIRLGSPDAMAEELIQEVMLLVWRKADQFDPSRAAATTWIYTITRNRRIDRLRRERRPVPGGDDPLAETTASPAGEAVVAFRQDRIRIGRAMKTLPEDQAIVVRMAFMEDKSHSMIAEELDIPLGTVKSRMRLAFKRLREELGEER
ncbi:MAG: sigma-70 family RNA polymerase sigma factor [Sphingomonadales bacterium]